MPFRQLITLASIVMLGCGGGSATQPAAPKKQAAVKQAGRGTVRRPETTSSTSSTARLSTPAAIAKRTWDNFPLDQIFFDNPAAEAEQASAGGQIVATVEQPVEKPAESPQSAAGAESVEPATDWEKLVSADVLQAEVAAIRGRLDEQMAALELYNGHYRELRVDAAVLAVIAGIVARGEFDVPWSHQALHIRDVAGQLSSQAGGLGPRNYNPAHASYLKLAPLFGGKPGKVEGLDANPIRDLPWINVADLSKLMQRMKTAFEIRLKESAASQADWRKAQESAVHEAGMLVLLAEVISTSYDGSADEEYREFAAAMREEALGLVDAARRSDFEAATQRINSVARSCKSCHNDYRFSDDF